MKFAISRPQKPLDQPPCNTAEQKVAYFKDADGRTVPHQWWEMTSDNVGAVIEVLQKQELDSSVEVHHAPQLEFIKGDEVPEIEIVLRG